MFGRRHADGDPARGTRSSRRETNDSLADYDIVSYSMNRQS
jgi:hypothetical protein